MKRPLLLTGAIFLGAFLLVVLLGLHVHRSGPTLILEALVADLEEGTHFTPSALRELTTQERAQTLSSARALLEEARGHDVTRDELEPLLEHIESAYDDGALSTGELRALSAYLSQLVR